MISDPLRQQLRTCQNIVVFTGAGMSAESGIPTFRELSRALGLEAEFPIYIGDGYIANAFDMDRAAELHGCPYFPVGHMVFLPNSCAEIGKQLMR